MPTRLRPTAPFAADAILVGDPGRALLLAQELLEQPKMSNHARGLWGYSGRTPGGAELTIQATGMGGPSAAIVLADLAELGVRRAIRVGTCSAVGDRAALGELLLPEAVFAVGGSSSAFGLSRGDSVSPSRALSAGLANALENQARGSTIASVDAIEPEGLPEGVAAIDLQTAAVLALAAQLSIPAAAVLIVSEHERQSLDQESLEAAARRAGNASVKALSG